jgi:hypothetical protein
MGLLQRKTRLGTLIETVGGAQLPAAVGSALANVRPPKAVKSGLTAAVALTAGSAAVSAMRKRGESAERGR